MNSTQLITFFRKEFLHKQIQWLTGIFFFTCIVITIFQLSAASKTYQARLDTILDLNKDEILNSIVLGDNEGIKQHLEILQNEYELDGAQVIFNGNIIRTGSLARNAANPISFWVEDNYSKVVSNDFKTVSFLFEANYYSGIFRKTLLPATLLSFGFLGLLVLVTLIIFRFQQRKIQRLLIDPLIHLQESIKTGDYGEAKVISTIEELNYLSSSLEKFNRMKEQTVTSELASQLAHDIRSPLVALQSLKSDLLLLPEDSRRRFQLSINRIEEIAFNLLKKQKEDLVERSSIKAEELLSLLESVKMEKMIEFRNHSNVTIEAFFDSSSYGLFSKVERGALKTIISNLINNAVEALAGAQGHVKLTLSGAGDRNIIRIVDDGPGISEAIRDKIFIKGFTTKESGNGLGLSSAKLGIEAVGGTLAYETELGIGTAFIISLPKADRPASFVPTINVQNYRKIIILDDDPGFHEVWRKRLEPVKEMLESIYSVKEIFSRYQKLDESVLLLSDFELMDGNFDGIDTISKLNHAAHSILVTARSEERSIQERCQDAGIKVLPKSMVNYVSVTTNMEDIVLIDDDRLTLLNWQHYCKKRGFKFHAFQTVDEFIRVSETFSKTSKIYIDSQLGDDVLGEVESKRIFNLGFLNLYLATGHDKSSMAKPHWIKDIYSKSPECIH